MKFREYFFDNLAKFCIFFALGFFVISLLFAARVEIFVIIFCAILFVIFGAILFFFDFFQKKNFYKNAREILENLDEKSLLFEIISRPNFLEGEIFYEILGETNRATNEKLANFRRQISDFRDYVELWIHEIKTPLANINLLAEKQENLKKSAREMENYIEQILFYAKTGDAKNDYVITKINLENLVKNALKNNKEILISAREKIKIGELNFEIRSDKKWLEFILNQMILNAVKYRKKLFSKNSGENPEIEISAQREKIGGKNLTILKIKDNGIGIKNSEISRVFEKGFSGENGRARKNSTGMGLYISAVLARELGHEIRAKSEVAKWTEFEIYFSRDEFLEFENEENSQNSDEKS